MVGIEPPDQYKELCNDHRFFGDLRFKQLTVWSAAMAILLNAVLSHNLPSQPDLFFVLPIVGIAFTAVFWVLEIRSTLKGVIALKKVREFESANPRDEKLGKANWTFVNQTNAVALLYMMSYTGWWFVMFLHRSKMPWAEHILIYLLILPVVFLCLFTVREYVPLWENALTQRAL